jgi:hypothetical protein
MRKPLAGLEIELPAEGACDRRRSARAHGFFRRPQSFGLVGSVDEGEARRIETEIHQAISMQCAAARELAEREDKKQGRMTRRASE